VLGVLSLLVGDLQGAVVVVQVGGRQLTLDVDANFAFEVTLDLLHSFLDWQFGFEITFTVKLGCLDETLVTAGFVGCGEDDAVSRDLLLILEHEDVTDLDISEAGLDNVFVTLLKCSDFLNGCQIGLFVLLMACVVSDTFLQDTNEDNDTQNDGNDSWGVNANLWERVQDHDTEPGHVSDLGKLDNYGQWQE